MASQPAQVQLLHEHSDGYQLFLVSFVRDSEKQFAFVVADDLLGAYQVFKNELDSIPARIQQIDLAGMGFFLLKRKENWGDE